MLNKEDWEILYTLATNEGLRKKDVRYEQAYDNIVNLFYEKDKQINLMAELVYKRFKAELLLEYGFENEEQLKQYFADLVERE